MPARLAVAGTPYYIIRPMGGGATGRVYEVARADSPERFALKLLRPEFRAGDGLLERLRDECAPLRTLHTPERAPYPLDLGVTARGAMFYTTWLLEGRSLRAEMRLRRGTGAAGVNAAWAGSIAHQILSELANVHAAGVVHGDLKPENVLVLPTFGVSLLDVGFTRCLEALAHRDADGREQTLAAARYAAPERLGGVRTDPRSDLYSVGVILQELLGDAPADGSGGGASGREGAPGDEERPIEAFARIVRRATERRPEDRYPSAQAFLGEVVLAVDAWPDEIGPNLVPAPGAKVLAASLGWPVPRAASAGPAQGEPGAQGPSGDGAQAGARPRSRLWTRGPVALACIASAAGAAGTSAVLHAAGDDEAAPSGLAVHRRELRQAEAAAAPNAEAAAASAPAAPATPPDEKGVRGQAETTAAPTSSAPSATPDASAGGSPAETAVPSAPASPAARLAPRGDGAERPRETTAESEHEAAPPGPPPAPMSTAPALGGAGPASAASASPAKKRAAPPAVPMPVKRWIPIEMGKKR